MADLDDVRVLVRDLPGTAEEPARHRFVVLGKPICWTWLERTEPNSPRRPRPDVLAVRVRGDGEKHDLIALDSGIFFTEPHYDGYPAVLARLPAMDRQLLREVLIEAWRVQAPRALVREWDAR
jgi:hypothetical protein